MCIFIVFPNIHKVSMFIWPFPSYHGQLQLPRLPCKCHHLLLRWQSSAVCGLNLPAGKAGRNNTAKWKLYYTVHTTNYPDNFALLSFVEMCNKMILPLLPTERNYLAKGKVYYTVPRITHSNSNLLSFVEIRNDLMMTSSNGNIFRVTGHLCGEFNSQRWIPCTKASDAELWYFLWSAPE